MKIFFVSFGCDKNKVDSEKILKYFLNKYKKIEVIGSPIGSDISIVNTCSFISDAKKESEDYIKYLCKLKRYKKLKKIIVLGCLATEIVKRNINKTYLDEVDAIIPLNKYINDLNYLNDRVVDILSFSSFIKISDGCDKYCSYCIIPYLRGGFRSNKIENIINECKLLAKRGVKELSIVGQDVLSYGKDIYGKYKICDLIDKISEINGIEWIRLMYCYPEEVINSGILKVFKENKKVIPYIDMPIQHSSNKILKLMNRKTTKENIINIVNNFRKEVPNIFIRTTIMVGFPGETEKDFKELIDFIKEVKFDKLGCFTYSKEKLSKSYNFKNQVSEIDKIRRKKELLKIQKKIVKAKNKNLIGQVYYSIVEGYDTNKKMYVVRPYFDARDIDDKVYVKSTENLFSGDFLNVELIKMQGIDFIGQII